MNQQELQQLLEYRKGKLYWKIQKSNRSPKGSRAGTYINSTGYRGIQINGRRYQEHRLVFLYHHGYMPEIVDHIDRNKLNNHIENLRPADKHLNAVNIKHCQVFYDTSSWRSRLSISKGTKISKRFKTKEEAIQWRDAIVAEWFGDLTLLLDPTSWTGEPV